MVTERFCCLKGVKKQLEKKKIFAFYLKFPGFVWKTFFNFCLVQLNF